MSDRGRGVSAPRRDPASEPGEVGVSGRCPRQHRQRLIDLPVIQLELDAEGLGLGVLLGQRPEDAFDPRLFAGMIDQEIGQGDPAEPVIGVGPDERFQVLGDVRPPGREVSQGPGEQVVMRERREPRELAELGVNLARRPGCRGRRSVPCGRQPGRD